MPYVKDCEVTARLEVAAGHYRLALNCPEIAAAAKPGQFCMIQAQEGLYPFLRRPMSIERIFPDGISILFKVEGEGTKLLAKQHAGHKVNVQGPLGKGFPMESAKRRHILVAGGIGVAPFPALADAIIASGGKAPEVIIAARSESLLLCKKDFRQMGCSVRLATDDGSAGQKGFAADVLKRMRLNKDDVVYTCGPMVMMRSIHEVCVRKEIPCYASLEAEMACGDGVCLGCVVEANVEIESERMVRVCHDGPVFESGLIRWERY